MNIRRSPKQLRRRSLFDEDGGVQPTQAGFALDLASTNGRFELYGGTAWIASITSSDTQVRADFSKTSTNEYPTEWYPNGTGALWH